MTSNIFELGLLQGATVLFPGALQSPSPSKRLFVMTLQQVLGNVAIPGLGGYLTYLIATCISYAPAGASASAYKILPVSSRSGIWSGSMILLQITSWHSRTWWQLAAQSA